MLCFPAPFGVRAFAGQSKAGWHRTFPAILVLLKTLHDSRFHSAPSHRPTLKAVNRFGNGIARSPRAPLVGRRELAGVDDRGPALAQADTAAQAERLAKGEAALAGVSTPIEL